MSLSTFTKIFVLGLLLGGVTVAEEDVPPESAQDVAAAPLLSRYDFELVRGESNEHAAAKPIVFVNGAGVGVKQDPDLFTDELIEQFLQDPEIEGNRGIDVEVLELQMTKAAEDASSVLVLHGRFRLKASEKTPAGERTIRVRLPALLEWSQKTDLLTSSESQFEFMGRVYESKLDKKIHSVPADPTQAIAEETAEIKQRNVSVMNNGTMLWISGAAFSLLAVAIGWFVLKRFFTYTS